MGIQKEAKGRMVELKTGVHLVTIHEKGVVMIKDKDDKPIVSESGEMGVRFRLMDNDGKIFDQDFWLNGNRQWVFDDFCKAAGIDPLTQEIRKESKGRRLWICIKEIWKINGTETIMDPLTGEPDLSYQIFKFLPFDNSGKKPVVPGDPDLNKGQALEPFVDYIDIKGVKPQPVPPPAPPEKKAIDEWEDF